jgi:hypothetical protein
VIGSYFTTVNNNATIAAQREQSVEQFRRDHRQEVYATILKQATNVENASGFGASVFGALGAISLGGAGFRGGADRVMTGPAVTGLDPSPGERQTVPQLDQPPPSDASVLEGITSSFKSNLGVVRNDWQSAYTALDQAISDAEIFSTTKVIDLARALRDKYRDEYYKSVLAQLEALPKDKQETGSNPGALADALVGVPAPPPEGYDAALLNKSTDELTEMFVEAAQDDLELNER